MFPDRKQICTCHNFATNKTGQNDSDGHYGRNYFVYELDEGATF